MCEPRPVKNAGITRGSQLADGAAQQTMSPGAWEQREVPVARSTSDLYPVPWEMRYFGGD